MFKQYKRKIHVFVKDAWDPKQFRYVWSTMAYRTCKEAIAAAKAKHPQAEFKASFKW
jgi:hypothetical protein